MILFVCRFREGWPFLLCFDHEFPPFFPKFFFFFHRDFLWCWSFHFLRYFLCGIFYFSFEVSCFGLCSTSSPLPQ